MYDLFMFSSSPYLLLVFFSKSIEVMKWSTNFLTREVPKQSVVCLTLSFDFGLSHNLSKLNVARWIYVHIEYLHYPTLEKHNILLLIEYTDEVLLWSWDFGNRSNLSKAAVYDAYVCRHICSTTHKFTKLKSV